ncbi:MAG: Pol I core factor CF [Vezdaea acicularis]|nr:MAG: Pol I core factor CF [Vezdaea acicularis]
MHEIRITSKFKPRDIEETLNEQNDRRMQKSEVVPSYELSPALTASFDCITQDATFCDPRRLDTSKWSTGEERYAEWIIAGAGNTTKKEANGSVGFRVVEDEDAFGAQGRKSRRKEEKEKAARIYSGRRAFELFLQCYQLVLWKQVHWLISVKDFPPELEAVVKDLWALRLQLLRDKTEDLSDSESQQTFYTSATETPDSSSGGERRKGRARWTGKDVPQLIETLALCYLGTLLLRLPISLGDLQLWASEQEITFVRAIRFIPKEMLSHLPPNLIISLDSRAIMQPQVLHKTVLELVLLFNRSFAMAIPPLNWPLLLFRYIKDLCLPLDTYMAVKRLASMLSYEFQFRPQRHRYRIIEYPETRLMSLVLVAIKLSQSFAADDDNNIPVQPATDTEPAALAIDWAQWARLRTRTVTQPTKGELLRTTEEDVFKMSGEGADAYLDWYEDMWVRDFEPHQRSIPKAILDMFPTSGPAVDPRFPPLPHSPPLPSRPPPSHPPSHSPFHPSHPTLLPSVLASLKPLSPSSTPSSNRPGTSYRTYRTETELPDKAKPLFAAAAELVGVHVRTLVKAVYQAELRLRAWKEWEGRRREEEEGAEEEGAEAGWSEEGDSTE